MSPIKWGALAVFFFVAVFFVDVVGVGRNACVNRKRVDCILPCFVRVIAFAFQRYGKYLGGHGALDSPEIPDSWKKLVAYQKGKVTRSDPHKARQCHRC